MKSYCKLLIDNIVKRFEETQNYRLLIKDIVRFFLNCFIATILTCVCAENGWIPFEEATEISYNMFWNFYFTFIIFILIIKICQVVVTEKYKQIFVLHQKHYTILSSNAMEAMEKRFSVLEERIQALDNGQPVTPSAAMEKEDVDIVNGINKNSKITQL